MSATLSWWGLQLLVCGIVMFHKALLTHATVYSWIRADGVLVLSNGPEEIPVDRRGTVKTFTSQLTGKPTLGEAPAPLPPSPAVSVADAHERGLERGLQVAERQIATAGELARTVLSAVPPVPPTRIIIQQSAPIVRYAAPGYDSLFFGFVGPYAPYFPYGWSYAYGFRHGRFMPHSHFFPGTRSRRQGLFFPHGHFSQNGFLLGHGFVIP